MRRMLVVASVVTLLGLRAAPAPADIAPDPEYGTSLAPWGPCGVRMADEHVTIRLEKERVLVKAAFTLVNGDKPARLRVGFPDTVTSSRWSSDVSEPPEPGDPKLLEFRARVDGQEQAVTPRYYQEKVGPLERGELAEAFRAKERALEQAATPEEKARLQKEIEQARETYGWWSSAGWLTWQMDFAAGATRTVEVTYRTSYRGAYRRELLGAAGFDYILKTGAFWDGVIGRALVDVELGEGLVHAQVDLEPAGAVKTSTGWRWDWKDLEPTFDVRLNVRSFPDMATAAKAMREQALAAEASGELGAAAEAWSTVYYASAAEKRWDVAAEAAGRVAGLERTLAGDQGPANPKHPRVRFDVRAAYVPWEALRLEALVAAGDGAGARAAAAEAKPVLEAWLAVPGPSMPWGRLDVDAVKAALERARTLLTDAPAPAR